MKSAWRWPAAIAVLLTITVGPVLNWKAAETYSALGTLRWCVVTKRPISAGARFAAEDVGLTIERVGPNDTCVADVRRAVGNYAVSNIAAEALLRPTHVSDLVPARVPLKGAAVPVEVKTEHSGSVQPGTRVAFVQEKEKRTRMIPAPKGKGAKRKWQGLEVIAMAPSAKDASITTLTVAVEAGDVSLIPALASGQWRPVIVSAP